MGRHVSATRFNNDMRNLLLSVTMFRISIKHMMHMLLPIRRPGLQDWNMVRLTDLKKAGTYSFWAKYAKIGKDSVDWAAIIAQFPIVMLSNSSGVEGPSVGLDYVFSKNAMINIEYDKFRGFATAAYPDTRNYNPFISTAVQLWF